MIKVYLAKMPDGKIENLYSKERMKEINLTNCKNVKREKYWVWKVLESAIELENFSPKEVVFYKDGFGKWKCSNIEFSLTHSGDFVGVAISDTPVGIDLQIVHLTNPDKFANRFLNQSDLEKYLSTDESEKTAFLISHWAKLESAFKLFGDKKTVFDAKTDGLFFFEKDLILEEKPYRLSVCAHRKQEVDFKFLDLKPTL